jgi:hypothetical protein
MTPGPDFDGEAARTLEQLAVQVVELRGANRAIYREVEAWREQNTRQFVDLARQFAELGEELRKDMKALDSVFVTLSKAVAERSVQVIEPPSLPKWFRIAVWALVMLTSTQVVALTLQLALRG